MTYGVSQATQLRQSRQRKQSFLVGSISIERASLLIKNATEKVAQNMNPPIKKRSTRKSGCAKRKSKASVPRQATTLTKISNKRPSKSKYEPRDSIADDFTEDQEYSDNEDEWNIVDMQKSYDPGNNLIIREQVEEENEKLHERDNIFIDQ